MEHSGFTTLAASFVQKAKPLIESQGNAERSLAVLEAQIRQSDFLRASARRNALAAVEVDRVRLHELHLAELASAIKEMCSELGLTAEIRVRRRKRRKRPSQGTTNPTSPTGPNASDPSTGLGGGAEP